MGSSLGLRGASPFWLFPYSGFPSWNHCGGYLTTQILHLSKLVRHFLFQTGMLGFTSNMKKSRSSRRYQVLDPNTGHYFYTDWTFEKVVENQERNYAGIAPEDKHKHHPAIANL